MVAQNTSKYLLIFKFFRLFNKLIQKSTEHTTSSLLIMDVVCVMQHLMPRKRSMRHQETNIFPLLPTQWQLIVLTNWEITKQQLQEFHQQIYLAPHSKIFENTSSLLLQLVKTRFMPMKIVILKILRCIGILLNPFYCKISNIFSNFKSNNKSIVNIQLEVYPKKIIFLESTKKTDIFGI
jgi:hypothetical protein